MEALVPYKENESSYFRIAGGNQLKGEIKVQGAKNAVLPVLAGVVLNRGTSRIKNCPKILDVECMIKILKEVGCKVQWEGDVLIIDSKNINTSIIPEKYVREMRSSIILLGSILGRMKSVKISFPGGCSIGTRPIDLHLKALKKMNVEVVEKSGYIECKTSKIIGNKINLDYPSVGATENIMLAAVLSEGETYISNAAKEPEIIELQSFLNKMGGNIQGAGTDEIIIKGVSQLHDVEFTIMPDRIVAGTYLAAAAITNGEIHLKNTINQHFSSATSKLIEMGCYIREYSDSIYLRAPERLKAVDLIRTQPYPGFPTDMQSQFMSLLTNCDGTSVITETIFESRFKSVGELMKMGANIITEGRSAIIKGPTKLNGAEVFAKDLRGGAALIIAALSAEGVSIIKDVQHVLRGYEDVVGDLKSLGATMDLINIAGD
ncbi:UDP-N-acetylglucosamine 1-carboxyvinyltransferase [Natranaerovirga pectinivora]|uniref:UDP-N-acetylglucosamine 1-carboxyvinyltransferase n=1 Tax=Natranaerovirga pectinivora TaxID=682400 RepID=A0A4R3MRN8_9FIRM|nr:UDP-N-acetylglucosamine 1-carboxyvinyltransferase [Natranaerovirga pectinivora]TCT16858.1 UDP-N-acetylglucosamine 1-carboxyvinyltransferase [Natranaerovirga pectinivora]